MYNYYKNKLGLPDWFGENTDALWDMLTGYIKLPCRFVFTGFNKKENEYNKDIIENILKCFLDAQKQSPENLLFKLIINFVNMGA